MPSGPIVCGPIDLVPEAILGPLGLVDDAGVVVAVVLFVYKLVKVRRILADGGIEQEALTGWLSAIADYDPVTYLLAALRALLTDGWDVGALLGGVASIAVVGAVSSTLALVALRGRVSRT